MRHRHYYHCRLFLLLGLIYIRNSTAWVSRPSTFVPPPRGAILVSTTRSFLTQQLPQQHPFLSSQLYSTTSSSPDKSSRPSNRSSTTNTIKNRLLTYDHRRIRNFSIIAHIDHGKSTLADRLLETTNTVAARDMEAQLLDNMDLERERGITIKLRAARVLYPAKDGETYCLNLIDTPGHVDFSYEVSRSLAACEGALLVVDASQGIEAQTLANVYLALENNLEIIPVLNKIDLPAADPDRVAEEIEQTIGLDCTDIVRASAKAGIGIDAILEAIVKHVPPPPKATGGPFRALIFDSYYDTYRGIVVFFRVIDGSLSTGDKVRFLASSAEHEVTELGIMQPNEVPVDILQAGEVGYLWGSIKDVLDARVGDTITLASEYKKRKAEGLVPPIDPLPGYAKSTPMVYCGLFPVDADDYEGLRDALGKLTLNDASLSYEPESSGAMGFGFRCGFLGLLHMEIIQERLLREYDMDLIVTAPSVVYKVKQASGKEITVDAPSKMPDLGRNDEALEPYVRMEILTPSEYNGAIIELAQDRRGELVDIKFLTPTRSTIIYELPLAEVITDFFDVLKSATKGYASMEFNIIDYRPSDLVRLDVKINYEDAPPLACITHRDKAQALGRKLCIALKEHIPRQMFKIPIQACIGVKVIASESISPMRKDVLAKCYGGDITRKKKLLQKQAKGKKRMKAIGKVSIPQEAFTAVLRLNDSNNN